MAQVSGWQDIPGAIKWGKLQSLERLNQTQIIQHSTSENHHHHRHQKKKKKKRNEFSYVPMLPNGAGSPPESKTQTNKQKRTKNKTKQKQGMNSQKKLTHSPINKFTRKSDNSCSKNFFFFKLLLAISSYSEHTHTHTLTHTLTHSHTHTHTLTHARTHTHTHKATTGDWAGCHMMSKIKNNGKTSVNDIKVT